MLPMLQRELSQFQSQELGIGGIEKCLLAAGNHWAKIKVALLSYEFESIEEEVWFFKVVKPQFTSELEYYGLLYHSALFCPPELKAQRKFWIKESKRLEEFKAKNKTFYLYHISGYTLGDKEFFTREHGIEKEEEIDDYNNEPRARSAYDQLVAMLIALERYHVFVLEQQELVMAKKS
jgi:RteC protein